MAHRNLPRPAAVYGIDIGKNLFHVVGLSCDGTPVQKVRFRRDTLLQFFARAQPSIVGMESCAGSQWIALVTRDGSLVVEAMTRTQGLFPWVICGADFDNDSAFMNDDVVPWCRAQKIEVTRSRAYKTNDQAFVEQKNGAVVRRLVGYGRFDGVETARVMARLYAAARLLVNFFQPSFKLKEKRREGAKIIKRYHPPATPYERALGTSRGRGDNGVKNDLKGSRSYRCR
ncbi:hypothetical protein M2202_009824 [Bradyrhizobium japonicum]|uniref:hypothetical protein n=1 Tax=Bradyrhizobium japonicum TaxID=375 RepID=UPI0020A0C31F|nr:hypothetical protein [Bradyrhizobium japonicum]MCP1768857.1 hypothetical protein [Bradyrhizobium japonicum]MCP1795035.1 hypothetical protein [Bradyrhizobium japonicum]MCP1811443.1 hypothetical protein [Bradyrhizobium japonicum]MCP1821647.1 hypothetical protein [Bradyrhizobium japonicum]MCP1876672.1 hypothetical protein [Bradyrhizobium japonicum]